jgi:hypothetical protein
MEMQRTREGAATLVEAAPAGCASWNKGLIAGCGSDAPTLQVLPSAASGQSPPGGGDWCWCE